MSCTFFSLRRVHFVLVWIALILVLRLRFLSFFFFFSFSSFQPQWLIRSSVNSTLMHCSWIPQIPLFINFFIKNRSHSTIHIFKNYFATVFSVFSFSKISYIQTNPTLFRVRFLASNYLPLYPYSSQNKNFKRRIINW